MAEYLLIFFKRFGGDEVGIFGVGGGEGRSPLSSSLRTAWISVARKCKI